MLARGLAIVVLLAVFLPALAGCCAVVPVPGRYFRPDRDPDQALAAFVYAIETEQWDYACWCLTRNTLEKFSCLELRFGLSLYEHPDLEAPILTLILESVAHRDVEMVPEDETETWAYMEYDKEVRGQRKIADLTVPMRKELDPEDGRSYWKVDLLGSIERMTGMAIP